MLESGELTDLERSQLVLGLSKGNMSEKNKDFLEQFLSQESDEDEELSMEELALRSTFIEAKNYIEGYYYFKTSNNAGIFKISVDGINVLSNEDNAYMLDFSAYYHPYELYYSGSFKYSTEDCELYNAKQFRENIKLIFAIRELKKVM